MLFKRKDQEEVDEPTSYSEICFCGSEINTVNTDIRIERWQRLHYNHPVMPYQKVGFQKEGATASVEQSYPDEKQREMFNGWDRENYGWECH